MNLADWESRGEEGKLALLQDLQQQAESVFAARAHLFVDQRYATESKKPRLFLIPGGKNR